MTFARFQSRSVPSPPGISPLYLPNQEFPRQELKNPGRISASKSYTWLYCTSGCAEYPSVLRESQPGRKAEQKKAGLATLLWAAQPASFCLFCNEPNYI